MDCISFLILLVISMVVSAIMHFGMNYYVTAGLSSYFSKVVIGWVGAYWGMRMLGDWWNGLNYGQVYFVPALLRRHDSGDTHHGLRWNGLRRNNA